MLELGGEDGGQVRTAAGALAAAFIAGCAHTSIPQYEAPNMDTAAIVENYGMVGISTSTCQLPGASPLCRASLLLVDGKRLPLAGNEARIAPGAHRVRIMCTFWRGGPAFFGSMDGIAKDVEVELAPGRRYFVRAEMMADRCDPWIADSSGGGRFGKALPFGAAQRIDETPQK